MMMMDMMMILNKLAYVWGKEFVHQALENSRSVC
jgi:hypothetical protein